MIPLQKLMEIHRKSIFKENSTEGFLNVFIFRKISILISWILASLRINPNFITTISFSLNLFAGMVLIFNFHESKYLAITLIAMGHILDMCDGEVARLLDRKSRFGAFYDPFLDRIIDIVLPFFIGIGHWKHANMENTFLLILIATYLGIRAGLLYMEKINVEVKIKTAIETVREKSSSVFKNSFGRYIKWDGGFTIVLYSIAIYFDFVQELFLFLVIFLATIFFTNFYRIRISLK